MEPFDISSIDGGTVVAIGMRCAWRSHIAKPLLYHNRDKYNIGVVISPTEPVNPFYNRFIPDQFIYDCYSHNIVDNFVQRQELVNGSSLPGAFLVMDDCIYDYEWTRQNSMTELVTNTRQLNTLLMICMVYPMGIPPLYQNNIDYVFMARNPISQNRKKLHSVYALRSVPDYAQFCEYLDIATEDGGYLVIDNKAGRVFSYEAAHDSQIPKFKLGSEEYWPHVDEDKPIAFSYLRKCV
jgi:hypothetical protein